MIIDIHAHPVLLDVINEDPEDLSFRKQQFGVFKSGRNPIEFEKLLIDDARIDKVVWLPEDYSTQMVYMDSPRNYYSHLFSVNMNLNWLQNCFQDKVMFGSNNPRFRHVRSLDGILNLPLREDVKKAILGENAIRFLGLED